MPNQMGLVRRPSSLWVDRGPTPAADFDETGLTIDAAVHDLDLSAIIPAGATWVLLSVMVQLLTGTGVATEFGKGGLPLGMNYCYGFADLTRDWFQSDFWLQLSPGRSVRYYVDTDGTILAELVVRGWII